MEEFSNIHKVKIPLQKKDGDKITSRRAGRPKKPNMINVLIRMDEGLKKRLDDYAHKYYTGQSAVIAQALVHLFNSE